MKDWKQLYFVGIGGIGMSALARYFNDQGLTIFGYDKTQTVLTKKLEDEGIIIHYEDNPKFIPEGIDVVVYTPAIPQDNKELQWFKDHDYLIMKRAALLGQLSENARCIAVAGTHGKTTTSSMISHILTNSSIQPSSILGGIPTAYGTNYIKGTSDWLVTEADEFDRSFLHLKPVIGVLMSVDPDHLDIYHDFSSMKIAFADFCLQIKDHGTLIVHKDALAQLDATLQDQLQARNIRVITIGDDADCQIVDARIENGRQCFSLRFQEQMMEDLSLRMAGKHNMENASAAIMTGLVLGLASDEIRDSLDAFEGIQRRFEWIIDREDVVMIDDYAHHPTELAHTIAAAKTLFPDRKMTVVFQPHLFSRTQDFMSEFAEVLSHTDELILMPIYPARELPIDGVSSEVLLHKVNLSQKRLLDKNELLDYFKINKPEFLLSLGAGDIGAEVVKIKQILTQ